MEHQQRCLTLTDLGEAAQGRCSSLPQVRAPQALVQPKIPPKKYQKRSQGPAKVQFQENRSSSEKGEIKDFLHILGKKNPPTSTLWDNKAEHKLPSACKS